MCVVSKKAAHHQPCKLFHKPPCTSISKMASKFHPNNCACRDTEHHPRAAAAAAGIRHPWVSEGSDKQETGNSHICSSSLRKALKDSCQSWEQFRCPGSTLPRTKFKTSPAASSQGAKVSSSCGNMRKASAMSMALCIWELFCLPGFVLGPSSVCCCFRVCGRETHFWLRDLLRVFHV